MDEVKSISTKVWFNFQSCMRAGGHDKEKLLKICTHFNIIKNDMKGSTSHNRVHHSVANIYAVIDDESCSGIVGVHNPNISRNKGCGSWIKSVKEKSMESIKDKRRKCSNHGQVPEHSARKCPIPKK